MPVGHQTHSSLLLPATVIDDGPCLSSPPAVPLADAGEVAAAVGGRTGGRGRSDADEVAEEMADAREMGMRQRPLPCRYCMAVPMSSSIIFATWFSVTRSPPPPLPLPLVAAAVFVVAFAPPPLLLLLPLLLLPCTRNFSGSATSKLRIPLVTH
jgi:hypothetical protein